MLKTLTPFYKAQTHRDVISVLEKDINLDLFKIIKDRKDSLYRIYIPKNSKNTYLPCLCTHSDTVHNIKPEKIIDHNGKLMNPAGGLGADDRNGIFILHTLMKKSFIFCVFNFEESGKTGSKSADLEYISKHASIFIGLDRQGNGEIGLRGYENKELINLLQSIDSFNLLRGYPTDAFQIARRSGICAVNLSVGFYKEHSKSEYSNPGDITKTISLLLNLPEKFWSKQFRYSNEKFQIPAGYSSFSIESQFKSKEQTSVYEKVYKSLYTIIKFCKAAYSGFIIGSLKNSTIQQMKTKEYKKHRLNNTSAQIFLGLSPWEIDSIKNCFTTKNNILVLGSSPDVISHTGTINIEPFHFEYPTSECITEKVFSSGVKNDKFDGAIIGWDTLSMLPDSASRKSLLKSIALKIEPKSPVLISFMYRNENSRFFNLIKYVSKIINLLKGEKNIEAGHYISKNQFLRFFTFAEIGSELFNSDFNIDFYYIRKFSHVVAYT